jgi:predicted phosphohydrolase
VRELGASSVVLSGDIAEGPTLKFYLGVLEKSLTIPIYFVLGNHDFYRSSIRKVRALAAELTHSSKQLRWLPEVGVVELSPTVGLLGHDGWADGRLGDYERSTVMLNDYLLVDELTGMSPQARRHVLAELGDEAASFAREHLPGAMARFTRVYFVTHVPPFAEACAQDGKSSGDQWLPHFACGAVGDALTEAADAHPGCELTVLCGHTHVRGVARILPNLVVRTGGAVYGAPVIEEVIELDARAP